MRREITKLLAAKARERGGLLHESDATKIAKRPDALRVLTSSGLWQEVLPRVLAASTFEVTMTLLEDAAVLWDPNAILSHFSAARREGIWVPNDDRAWITAPFSSGSRSRPDVHVTRSRALPEIVNRLGHVRWTQPPRTIADLAGELTRNQLEAVLLSAIRLEKTTAAEVDLAAAPLKRRRGMTVLREVTSLWTPERDSMLEDGLHADVRAVVPSGVTRQHPVYRANGSLLAKLDVAIEELMLGFEADGLLFHSTDAQLAYDQQRDRSVMGRGWQVARFREGTLSHHAQVQRDIREIVEQRRRQLRVA